MLKLFERLTQGILYLARPFLPWREPIVLNRYEDLADKLNLHNKKRVFIVLDKNLENLKLHNALLETLSQNNITYMCFSEVQPNPTIAQVENALINYNKFGGDSIIGFGGDRKSVV